MATVDAAPREDDWLTFSAITKEELLGAIQEQRVAVVNVLEEKAKEMIPTTRHIPLSQLEARLGELDRGKDVVVYCGGPTCPLSRNAARVLADRGFHVRIYRGGLEEWTAAHLPMDATKAQAESGTHEESDASKSEKRPEGGQDETSAWEAEKREAAEEPEAAEKDGDESPEDESARPSASKSRKASRPSA